MLGVLSNYSPKAQKYIEAKSKLLDNAKNFYEGREKFIEVFKNGILPLSHNNEFKEEQQTNKEFNKKEAPIKPTKIDANELNKFIIKKETDINKELFKNYFKFETPTLMLKTLCDINDKNKNNQFVNTIKNGLIDLENEIKKMSEDEIKIEEPYEIVDIVEKILEFNKNKKEKD